MPRPSNTPDRSILEAALLGLESQRQKLEEQISQVRTLLGVRKAGRPAKSTSASVAPAATPTKKRVLSAEARKRIAAAQKKRWAAYRKAS